MTVNYFSRDALHMYYCMGEFGYLLHSLTGVTVSVKFTLLIWKAPSEE